MPSNCVDRRRAMLVIGAIVVAAGPALAAPPAAKPLVAEVGRELVDLPQCGVFHDGKAVAVDGPRRTLRRRTLD